MLTTSELWQRHHDFYVRLYREGKLDDLDRPQYELAMARERQGRVKYLPEDYSPQKP